MAARERGNSEVTRTFKRLGGFAEKKQDLFNALKAKGQMKDHIEAGGHPDYTVLIPPFGFFVEVKAAETNFSLNAFAPKQRDWLVEWASISYLWLFMGAGQVNSPVQRRRAWLVPWRNWLAFEQRLRDHDLAGLPYGEPHLLELRGLGLSATEMLQLFELSWLANSRCWNIPEQHWFWHNPHAQVSLFCPKQSDSLSTQEVAERALSLAD